MSPLPAAGMRGGNGKSLLWQGNAYRKVSGRTQARANRKGSRTFHPDSPMHGSSLHGRHAGRILSHEVIP
jgi:hypothetical protein